MPAFLLLEEEAVFPEALWLRVQVYFQVSDLETIWALEARVTGLESLVIFWPLMEKLVLPA